MTTTSSRASPGQLAMHLGATIYQIGSLQKRIITNIGYSWRTDPAVISCAVISCADMSLQVDG